MDQAMRIHIQQDKNNAFVGVGDVVRVKSKTGEIYQGEICCLQIKKEGSELHSVMDLKLSGYTSELFYPGQQASFWIENIEGLEILRFCSEEKAVLPQVKKRKKWSLGYLFSYVIRTALKTYLWIGIIVFVFAIIAPFIFFGPHDPFWLMVKYDSYSGDNILFAFYLNILRWLAVK